MLQCVNGNPSFFGRVMAVATTTAMSSSVIRRGRAPVPDADAMMINARRYRTES